MRFLGRMIALPRSTARQENQFTVKAKYRHDLMKGDALIVAYATHQVPQFDVTLAEEQ
jgi:hypothetical protein